MWSSLPALTGLLLLAALPAVSAPNTPEVQPPAPWEASASTCLECHALSSSLSHPLGVRPQLAPGAAAAAAGLPLAGGGIDCLTCHRSRVLDPGHTDRLGRDDYLRRPARTLCATCHATPVNPGSPLTHARLTGRAHLGGSQGRLVARGGLDRESRECLSCHDGSSASNAAVRDGTGSRLPWRGGGSRALTSEHPVGVEYGSLLSANGWRGLRPPSALPEELRLFDGRVGCGSCHSVYSGGRSMLALETERQLCLGCHIK